MKNSPDLPDSFEAEVTSRFGLLPNFFRSAAAAPGLTQQLWGFAKACYLDSPMPSVFKERLFVWLSRFCPMRYCIVRHVGFLLGREHGHAAGDPKAVAQSVAGAVTLLRRPTPWKRDMTEVYTRLESISRPIEAWPDAGHELEDAIFACAAMMFVEPARSEPARRALARALGSERFEIFSGCLAFIRTAHYWTMLHPEIETEEDMLALLRDQEELAQLLLEDPEADRCKMSERLFEELTGLRELNQRRELEKAKLALEEKDRQKDHFIATLAHELRNPLGAIRAATDAMRLLQISDDRAVRLVQRVDRQTTAMVRMLDDLLDASRIALGKVSVQTEAVALHELLRDIVEEQHRRVRQAGLELDARIDRPCVARADRMRLRQVIDNLFSNAIKFTPAGGTVSISLENERGFASVVVRDTGVGFDEQFATRMFEPFTQVEQDRNTPASGLGLGLAIASRLARLLGGSLTAASPGINEGAIFTLRIPLAEELRNVEGLPAPAPRWHRKVVLLVEGNGDVADNLGDLLRLAGFQAHVAHDGRAAVSAALEIVPDLILCNIGLPGEMDGFALARACRAEQALESVRLVAMSGHSSPQDHANARDAGFDSLLTKPLTHESLSSL